MTSETTTKSRKPKSPPVPSRSLEESFADVSKLYDQFTHAPFSRGEIASRLKVSAQSGPFAQRLFTIKEFALLETHGGDYRVSPLFKDMKAHERHDPEFKRAALRAVQNSDVFSQLLQTFSHKLPPVDTVAQRLESQKHFNPDRAKTAARVLESSLRFAGVLDATGNILPVREGPPGQAEDGETAGMDSPPPGDEEGQARPDSLRLQIPLGPGRIATVYYPPDLTTADAKKIGNVLGAVSGGSPQ